MTRRNTTTSAGAACAFLLLAVLGCSADTGSDQVITAGASSGAAAGSGGAGGSGGGSPSGGSPSGGSPSGGAPSGGAPSAGAPSGGGASGGGASGAPAGGSGGAPAGGTGGAPSGGSSGVPLNPFTPAADVPPSFDPPGGLAVAQVPQFVVFGFDDNRYTDGMQWVLDTIGAYANPAGNGNTRTYDGQPAKVSFYFTSGALDGDDGSLLAQWQRAVAAGHEVANHTHTHLDIPMESNWATEITQCNDALIAQLGVTEGDLMGIRAPFLSFSADLFSAIQAAPGMFYDCSVTHTPDDWENYRHVWPYTLDSGFHSRTSFQALGNFPGVWEVPVYTLPRQGPERATSAQQPFAGFDSTAYGTVGMSASDFYNSLVWALDLRLEDGDNRSPLTIGVHSDTYSSSHTGYDAVASLADRRQVIIDFLDYALTHPAVRIVSTRQVIEWMSDPVAL